MALIRLPGPPCRLHPAGPFLPFATLPPMMVIYERLAWMAAYGFLLAAIVYQDRARRARRRLDVAADKHAAAEARRFARLLARQDFRDYVNDLGWRSNEPLFPVHPAEPVGALLNRMDSRDGRGWLMISDPAAPFGFSLLAVGERRDGHEIEVTVTRGVTL